MLWLVLSVGWPWGAMNNCNHQHSSVHSYLPVLNRKYGGLGVPWATSVTNTHLCTLSVRGPWGAMSNCHHQHSSVHSYLPVLNRKYNVFLSGKLFVLGMPGYNTKVGINWWLDFGGSLLHTILWRDWIAPGLDKAIWWSWNTSNSSHSLKITK